MSISAFQPQSNTGPWRRSGSFSGGGQATDQLTLATYNVKNLFDGVDENSEKNTTAKPEAELVALAQQLKDSPAQLVTLQEVENVDVLQGFLDRYLPGQYSDVVLVEGKDPRGIDVAVLSKIPLDRVTSHQDVTFPIGKANRTTRFSRDVLRVDFQAGGQPWSVYTTHFKSRMGGPPADRHREAEAEALRGILAEEMAPFPGKNFVVMGDFNDRPDSETMTTVMHPKTLWNRFKDWTGCDRSQPLVSTAQVLSFPAHKPKEQIDYILVPEHLQSKVKMSGVVLGPQSAQASDHLMVQTTFDLKA